MLDQRTQNIIFICKGRHDYDSQMSMRDAIAKYMAETCGCDESDYSDAIIMQIISNCVIDIMENCSKDTCRRLIFDYFDCKPYSKNELDRWLISLDLMQIRECKNPNANFVDRVYEFLEGFDQNCVIDENTNETMFPKCEEEALTIEKANKEIIEKGYVPNDKLEGDKN